MFKISIMKTLLLIAAFSLFWSGDAISQKIPSKEKKPGLATANEIVVPESNSPSISSELSDIRLKLQQSEERLLKELNGLQVSLWEKLIPAGMGVLGVLIGTGLGGWFSFLSQKRQLESANKESAKEIIAHLMEFRSRQLNEFYAPMHFLVHGTQKLHHQLLEVLNELSAKNAANDFELKIDDHKPILTVTSDANNSFRLTQHMHLVAIRYDLAMPLVGEIVNIGEKISSLIIEKGGLAKTGSTDLADKLSAYLAHYSILKDVYKKAKKSPTLLASMKYNITFPSGLEKILKDDGDEIYNEISEWSRTAKKVLQPNSN